MTNDNINIVMMTGLQNISLTDKTSSYVQINPPSYPKAVYEARWLSLASEIKSNLITDLLF